MGVESLLKAGLKALPEKDMQGQKALNLLAKKGIKAEEFKFSGVEIQPEKIYTKKELTDLEAGRKDVFGKSEPADASYNFVSLEKGKSNPTYKENVYTYKEGTQPAVVAKQRTQDLGEDTNALLDEFDLDAGKPSSRYTSEHFPDVPNYLMHTRTFDDTMDGKPTRILQEIQSDLHQQGRVQGYTGNRVEVVQSDVDKLMVDDPSFTQQALHDADEDEIMEVFGVTPNELQAQYDALIARSGIPAEDLRQLSPEEILSDILESGATKGVPESPYEKSWLAKGIERELDQAIQDGRQQLAIPIKGAEISNLKRAEGVQKWYEGNVVNTAKKIAKQNGMDFELVEAGGKGKRAAQAFTENEATELADNYRVKIREEGFEGATNWLGDTLDTRLKGDFEGIDIETFLSSVRRGDAEAINRALDASPGTQYAIIKPKNEIRVKGEDVGLVPGETYGTGKFERPNLKLYSSPAAAVAAGYASLKAGGTEDDVRFELNEAGYEGDEIDEILGDAKFALESVDTHGDDEAEVMAFFKSQEPDIADVDSTPIDQPVEKSFWENVEATGQLMQGNPKKQAYAGLLSPEGMNAEQLLSRLQVISPNMSSITTRISGYYGNGDAAKKQEEAVVGASQHIVNLAAEHGITMAFQPNPEGDGIDQLSAFGGGKWYVQGPEGEAKPVDEGFWEAMRQESHEITYGITGAIGGAKAVSTVTKNPWLIGLGSVVGAMTGAGVGTQLDYLRDSVQLHEEMSASVAAHKALTAAEVSVIGDAVGYPLAKGAGQIWKATKAAKDFLFDGNTTGAYRALKDIMFLSDSEIVDITNGLNKATTLDASTMKPLEARIQATVLTQPGGEALVKAAGSIDAQAGAAVAKAIDNRAQDILATTAELTDDNVGRILAQDLSNYTQDVKQYYGDVKAMVAKSPRIGDFAWDFEAVGVRQAMAKVYDGILDDTVKTNFALRMNHINAMSDSRTLTDLIETRQLVNDFKFNKRITKAKDFDMLNEVLSNIDGAIRQGADVVMENPQQWLSNYTLAKTQYAKMKGLERNVIARALRRPGLTEETAVKALTKYITAIDGSFQDVMSSLPTKSRTLTEGAVIDVMANKYAAGTEGGQRAIHFPMLAAELAKVTLTTPSARKAKAAIKEMAEVFRNDIPLSQSTGNIQIPKFQSFLTTDPKQRIAFEFATGIFNHVKKLNPLSAEQRNFALVSKVAKLLESPLNARLMREVMEDVGGDVTITKQLLDLQKAAALAKDTGAARVKLYGNGDILSGKGAGNAVEIPVHRIATYEAQQTIANKYGIDLADKKLMNQALKGEGYMAVQLGSDKVRRLK